MQIIEYWLWIIIGLWVCLVLYYMQWAMYGEDYDKGAQEMRDLWHKNNNPKN
jgi:hypothetical protein